MTRRAGATQPVVDVRVCEIRVDTRRLARLLAAIVEEQTGDPPDCGEPRTPHRKENGAANDRPDSTLMRRT